MIVCVIFLIISFKYVAMTPPTPRSLIQPLTRSINHSISSRAPGVVSFIRLFCSLLQGAVAPLLASALPASSALLPEMTHGDVRDKHHHSEGSSCGSQSPSPCRMTMVASPIGCPHQTGRVSIIFDGG
jgi:hypothetical protein